MLAALMLKVGAFGFYRFILPVMPEACYAFAPVMVGLSLFSVVFIGLVTLAQSDIKKLIDAIKAGVPGEALRDEMQTLENQRTEIESKLEEAPVATPRLHPNLPAIYQGKITSLIDAQNTPDTVTQANKAIRQLIEKSGWCQKATPSISSCLVNWQHLYRWA